MEKQTQRSRHGVNTTPAPKDRHGAGAAQLPHYDVSIILNLHNEARYLKRTLLSLEEAVRYARQFDITFEIVVVLDNADTATITLAEGYDYSVFDDEQIIHVSNGSLGLSRNDGITVARGEYIATADGDDLISFDFLQRMYMTASSGNDNSIIFPEYIYAFGEKNYIWKFWEKKYITNSVFFSNHPYISRIFCKKRIFEVISYIDSSTRSGYAYEDWHFNCQCMASGMDIVIAKNAILFYRQRPGSLLRRTDNETSRMIPSSRYFDPKTYLKLNWNEFANGQAPPSPEKPFNLSEALSISGFGDVVKAANNIDPAISLGILKYSHAGSNFMRSSPAAGAYFELCRMIANTPYTDVILLPFLTKGGAEKYIISVLEALHSIDSHTRCLVLAGQIFDDHQWIERLPEGSLFVDIPRLCTPYLDRENINLVTFRLLQHLSSLKRIHVKGSEYGDTILKLYSSKLNHKEIYFYYFCDGVHIEDGIKFNNGHAFDLISEFGSNFHGIISDHSKVLEFAEDAIEADVRPKTHTLYAHCEVDISERPTCREPTFRLLWASRIDSQKRPDLLAKIARGIEIDLPNVSIDSFGSITCSKISGNVFTGIGNLHYKGGFDGFDSIPSNEYDALIYTSQFDGLPNIIIEAMGTGLPVIAPDVGGITEAITSRTGYIVEDDVSDEAMAERYAQAIRAIYNDWPDAIRRGENGRQLVLQRHSREAYLERVREIFGLGFPAAGEGGEK